MENEPMDIKVIFSEALEKENAEERATYLKEACGNDPDLRTEVEALLEAHGKAGSFLKSPACEDVTLNGPAAIDGPSTRIGRYELVELLGEGGMGQVYLADQKEPVKRRVALKIIKPGMDSRQVIARFEAERQALALLDHPNVAHVLDAGTTESGLPYFVMEYVKGMPITRYCDEHKLSIEQRLRLFEQVCGAVHHAHQKGIIHRDLKPSNILVCMQGDKAFPKIIDFGIAKAITQPLTDKTSSTLQGQLLGTPEYMSPEQVDLASRDIDTRSDIYSLGVVLYELLAGVLPFESESFTKASLAEIQRTIREQEPLSPSTRLTRLGQEARQIAESRRTQVVPLVRCLHRELEWIPMKAMRKDRCRRYRSASELADDIQNYLNGRPLMAGPETAIYRVQKFVRRHAGSVTTAALLAVAIVLGLVASTAMGYKAEQARRQEATARAEAEQSEQVAQEQRKKAEDLAEAYRRSLYANRIQLADAKHLEGNARRVHELLDSCPEDLHGWEWRRLNRVSDQSLMTIPGHNGVYTTVFSPDGKRIISGGYDRTIRVWDSATGEGLKVLRGHEDGIESLAVSPDGRRIASGSSDKTVRIWDAETGREVATLRGHKEYLRSVAFSPDGKTIISAAWREKVARIWDAQTGAELMTLSNESDLGCVAFSPDGKRIISGDDAGDIRFWDTATGKEVMTVPAHRGTGIRTAAFSPDGKRIVSVGRRERTVKVWDAQTGTLRVTIPAHQANAWSVSFSPDGKYIVSASDNTIKVWDSVTGEELRTFRGHERMVCAVAFSPDGRRLMSASEDGTIKLWDIAIDQEVTRLETHQDVVYSISYSPDGRRIAVASGDWMVKVWDVKTGDDLMTLHERREGKGRSGWVVFSPDGKSIASGGDDTTANVWNAETGEAVATLKGMVGPIAFSPDSRRIVCGDWDGTTRVWNATGGREVMSLRWHEARVVAVAFSPDGRHIASGDFSGLIKIWDAETGAELTTLKGHRHAVPSVAYSPDGRRIASASFDLTARIWDASTGKELMILRGLGDKMFGVAFSPDGKRIVTGDGTVRLWDATTGDELLTLRAGAGRVTFSPDGKTIAAGLYDGSVALWDSEPTAGYQSWKTAEAARRAVDDLYEKYGYYYEVIDRLQVDEALDDSVRRPALRIADSHRVDDAEKLDKEIKKLESSAARNIEACRGLLEKVQKASRLDPNDRFMLARVGMAQYRQGAYDDAMKTLSRVDQIRAKAQAEPNPAHLAYMAMTLHQLGRAEEAKSTLDQLRSLRNDERFDYFYYDEGKALLAETEGLIVGQKP